MLCFDASDEAALESCCLGSVMVQCRAPLPDAHGTPDQQGALESGAAMPAAACSGPGDLRGLLLRKVPWDFTSAAFHVWILWEQQIMLHADSSIYKVDLPLVLESVYMPMFIFGGTTLWMKSKI